MSFTVTYANRKFKFTESSGAIYIFDRDVEMRPVDTRIVIGNGTSKTYWNYAICTAPTAASATLLIKAIHELIDDSDQYGSRSIYGDSTSQGMHLQDFLTFANNRDWNENIQSFTTGTTGSSSDRANNMLRLQTGTTIFGFAAARGRKMLLNIPGGGAVARFSCIFNTGLQNSLQFAGVGNALSGLFFGYNGESFGICIRTGGVMQIVVLTVTAATGAGTATVTLNGETYTASLTNAGGDASFTAYQVAYAGTNWSASGGYNGFGWDAVSLGNRVAFIAQQPGPRSGTYSYSSTAGSTGSFTTSATGVNKTDTWIPQTSWNRDKLNGAGASGMTLNPLYGNTYEIQYSYEFGIKSFYVRNGNKNPILVHTIETWGMYTTLQLSHPNFPLLFAVASAGSTTNMTMYVAAYSGYSVNSLQRFYPTIYSKTNEKAISAGVETNILVLQPRKTMNSAITQSNIKLLSFSFDSDGTKNVKFSVYVRIEGVGTIGAGTTSDYLGLTQIDSNSLIFYDTTSKTQSGNKEIFSAGLAKIESKLIDVQEKDFRLGKALNFIFTALSAAGSNVRVSITWSESL